ncbi:hypothetical protein BDR03DRAFT_969127 [Suillus americanus]|nr:hypothetical protein BDR03DRAFT_969127 [Suillus americanus]
MRPARGGITSIKEQSDGDVDYTPPAIKSYCKSFSVTARRRFWNILIRRTTLNWLVGSYAPESRLAGNLNSFSNDCLRGLASKSVVSPVDITVYSLRPLALSCVNIAWSLVIMHAMHKSDVQTKEKCHRKLTCSTPKKLVADYSQLPNTVL